MKNLFDMRDEILISLVAVSTPFLALSSTILPL